jgi:Zn ribbon nucleic-acid-binding protein
MDMSHSSVDFKVGDEGRISVMCDGPACGNMDAIRSFVEDNVDGAEVVGESTSTRKEDVGMAIKVETEDDDGKPAKKLGIKNLCKGSVKK